MFKVARYKVIWLIAEQEVLFFINKIRIHQVEWVVLNTYRNYGYFPYNSSPFSLPVYSGCGRRTHTETETET